MTIHDDGSAVATQVKASGQVAPVHNIAREKWKCMYRAIRIARREIREEHAKVGIILSDATVDLLALQHHGIMYGLASL